VRQAEDAAAVEALIEGSRQFRAHWNRPEAIHLLRRARAIAPWHFEVVVELAGHVTRCDQKEEARLLLEGLAPRCEPYKRPRLRAAQLAVSPGPRSLWRWLQSLVARPESETAPVAEPAWFEPGDGDAFPPLRALEGRAEALSEAAEPPEEGPLPPAEAAR